MEGSCSYGRAIRLELVEGWKAPNAKSAQCVMGIHKVFRKEPVNVPHLRHEQRSCRSLLG
eukprot:1863645-Pyramimonas_sp.AAC.2